MTSQHVDLYLPKFRYELGLPYTDTIARVGIKNIFEYGKANLSAIGRLRNHISTLFDLHNFL